MSHKSRSKSIVSPERLITIAISLCSPSRTRSRSSSTTALWGGWHCHREYVFYCIFLSHSLKGLTVSSRPRDLSKNTTKSPKFDPKTISLVSPIPLFSSHGPARMHRFNPSHNALRLRAQRTPKRMRECRQAGCSDQFRICAFHSTNFSCV